MDGNWQAINAHILCSNVWQKLNLDEVEKKKKNESDEITGKHYPIKALQDFWMEVWPGDKARVSH